MLIVNQDRTATTENLELKIFKEVDKEGNENYIIENDRIWLGTYKNEERAKEVLEEIIDYYSMQNVDGIEVDKAIPIVLARFKSAFYIPKE